MKKIYISLGADCGTAEALRDLGKKGVSYPLDWLVCFRDVHKLFEHEFQGFLEDRVFKKDIGAELNPFYNIRFFHRERIPDYDNTLQRRVDRLLTLLQTEEEAEIVFIRRTHDQKHHAEIPRCGFPTVTEIDDVNDMRLLVSVLKRKYPKLKFKIHLYLQCPFCNKNHPDINEEHLSVVTSPQQNNLAHNERPYCQVYVDWINTL